MAAVKPWQWAAGIGAAVWFYVFWGAGAAQAAPGPGGGPDGQPNPPDPIAPTDPPATTGIPDSGGIVMDTQGVSVSDAVRQIAEAIAYAEGYYKGDGSINDPGVMPVRKNNPGDIKVGGTVATYPDISTGWAALYHQIQLILDGKSHYYTPTMQITAFASKYSAATGQELTNYAAVLAQHLGVDVTAPLNSVVA